ncbi:MAG: hypothetical protein M0P17_10240, partial [Methanoculleus sp.]|nr:hypothetical protein [Methanoculleus sp.]
MKTASRLIIGDAVPIMTGVPEHPADPCRVWQSCEARQRLTRIYRGFGNCRPPITDSSSRTRQAPGGTT